jgi:radical SAM protein with 4Fe4S-binding SPASM domain
MISHHIPIFIKKIIKNTLMYDIYRKWTTSVFKQRKLFITKNFPRVVGINLNESKCPLRCRMCPQHLNEFRPESKRFLSVETFKKVVDQMPHDPNLSFELASYGETLLTDRWKIMLKYAVTTKPDMSTVFVTNGLMMNENARNAILAYPPAVLQVSIDAPDAKTYEWLNGSKAFITSRDNFRSLCQAKKIRGLNKPILQTHIIDIEEFKEKVVFFENEWQEFVDHVNVRPLGNWGGVIDENGVTPMWTPPPQRYPCAWPFFATKIMPDGEIHKCHIHFLSGEKGVGNIHEKAIQYIWHDTPLKEVRQRQLKGEYHKEPMCERCNVWALFPNIWRNGEYKATSWRGKNWPGKPYFWGKDGRQSG